MFFSVVSYVSFPIESNSVMYFFSSFSRVCSSIISTAVSNMLIFSLNKNFTKMYIVELDSTEKETQETTEKILAKPFPQIVIGFVLVYSPLCLSTRSACLHACLQGPHQHCGHRSRGLWEVHHHRSPDLPV